VQLIVLLGEGTFHQIHGGGATSGRARNTRRCAGIRTPRRQTSRCSWGTCQALRSRTSSTLWAGRFAPERKPKSGQTTRDDRRFGLRAQATRQRSRHCGV
jgi:hypothetical protein